ncbi:hypothetical protein ES707_22315 [subsurface metagenome]
MASLVLRRGRDGWAAGFSTLTAPDSSTLMVIPGVRLSRISSGNFIPPAPSIVSKRSLEIASMASLTTSREPDMDISSREPGLKVSWISSGDIVARGCSVCPISCPKFPFAMRSWS